MSKNAHGLASEYVTLLSSPMDIRKHSLVCYTVCGLTTVGTIVMSTPTTMSLGTLTQWLRFIHLTPRGYSDVLDAQHGFSSLLVQSTSTQNRRGF